MYIHSIAFILFAVRSKFQPEYKNHKKNVKKKIDILKYKMKIEQ